MGKQRKADRLYMRTSERQEHWGGLSVADIRGKKHQKLPLQCCSLSLKPFEMPVSLPDGSLYEAENVMWYVKKWGSNPVNGHTCTLKDIKPVKFQRNSEDKYCDPITEKSFADKSHICLNRVSGYVYSYETVEQMNKKAKNFTDLVTSQKFNWSKDMLTIRDPAKPELGQIDLFHYNTCGRGEEVQAEMDRRDEGKRPEKEEATDTSHIRDTDSILRIREERERVAKERQEKGESAQPLSQPWKIEENKKRAALEAEMQMGGAGSGGPAAKRLKHGSHTTGAAAASFTSTVAPKASVNEMRDMTDEEMRKRVFDRVRKKKMKGYVRLHVEKWGTINVELHCDMTPLACDNFLRLADQGYYDGQCFHRCIRNFMIQGGDPTGTGTGGRSAFNMGAPFKDEFDSRLTYKQGGMLGMANSGKGTNKSQFFITFKMAEHLTNKHTLFGHVVGGMNLLNQMNENIETDGKDRPTTPVILQGITVFKNPYKDIEQEIADEENAEVQAAKEKEKDKDATEWFSGKFDAMKDHKARFSNSVGKYLNLPKSNVDLKQALAGLSQQEKEEAMIARPSKNRKGFSFDKGW